MKKGRGNFTFEWPWKKSGIPSLGMGKEASKVLLEKRVKKV